MCQKFVWHRNIARRFIYVYSEYYHFLTFFYVCPKFFFIYWFLSRSLALSLSWCLSDLMCIYPWIAGIYVVGIFVFNSPSQINRRKCQVSIKDRNQKPIWLLRWMSGNRNWSRPHYLFSGNKSRISLIWFRFSDLTEIEREIGIETTVEAGGMGDGERERDWAKKEMTSRVPWLEPSYRNQIRSIPLVCFLCSILLCLLFLLPFFVTLRLFHYILFKIIRFFRVCI